MKSKKKIFMYCIMTFMMALVMAMPMSVNAAGEMSVSDFDEFKAALDNDDISSITIEGCIDADEAITIDRDITIKNGEINFKGVSGNALTVSGGAEVSLNDVELSNDSAGKNVLHVYGSILNAANVTVNHGGLTGAPVIINNNSTVNFDDITVNLNSNSWYGVNVDNSKAKFNNIKANKTSGTQSVICEENKGAVEGIHYTVVKTADGQNAYVSDSNLPEFIEQKTKENKDIISITLHKDVELTAPLSIDEKMTVNGNGYTFKGTDSIGKDNVVTVTAEGIILENLGVKTSASNKSALHIYKVSTVLKNVSLDNKETVGGACLVVNSAKVTIEGTLDLKSGNNSWGGINVDARYGDAGVTFNDGAKVKYETADSSKPVMYKENTEANNVIIENAENAGLVENSNGTYSPAKDEPATNPEKPSTVPTTENQASADKYDESPKTGDDMNIGILFALMGMASVAAVGTIVHSRRKHDN